MNGLSVLIISICLGVLCVAGIKSIWLSIVETIEERKMRKFLDDNPDYFIKLAQLKHEIEDLMAK